MKKILALGVTLASFAAVSGAMAADLPSRKAPPAYESQIPLFTWTGFYAGLNAGVAFGNNRGGIPAIGLAGNSSNTRFTGGGQIGYNYQIGQFVVGIEADLNYLSGRNRNGGAVVLPAALGGIPAGSTITASGSNNNNYFGTVRPRIGFAVDRALLYVTGGLAYGGFNGSNTLTVTNPAGVALGTFTNGGSNNRVGYAVGGGIEYAVTNNWTVRGEYLYIGSGSRNRTSTAAAFPAATFASGGNRGFSVVRAAVNYKF